MALQPAATAVVAPKQTVIKAAPGKIVKKAAAPAKAAAKKTATKKAAAGPTAAEKAAAAKAKEKAAAAARQAKEDAQSQRAVENEVTRRANAIAKIQEAALSAGTQKSRIEIFMHKLQLRIERGCLRVAKMVDDERLRQAAALEKYPALKTLASSKKDLEVAATIPVVEIAESDLPAYITNISEEVNAAE